MGIGGRRTWATAFLGRQIRHRVAFMRHEEFDVEAFWRNKTTKGWVVCLSRIVNRREQREFRNVLATTADKAIATAKRNCLWKGKKIYGSARLAGPRDLGATECWNPKPKQWEKFT